MAAVVLDANVLVRLVLPSQLDPLARALWQTAAERGDEVHLPCQAISEALATLRRMVVRGGLTLDEGALKVGELERLAQRARLHGTQWRAWEAAALHDRPTTYDCEPYALAERLGADLWTADDRFVNAMQGQRPSWVHRLSDFSPTTS